MAAKIQDPDQALLFLLGHPLRRQLLRLYLKEDQGLSPSELALFTGQPLASVSFHVRALRDHGAVVLVAEEQRRGAVEHFYEATALVDEVPWARAALGLGGEAA